MTYPFPPDLQELIHAQMSAGGYDSQDDLLRAALQSLSADQENLAAVKQAIAEREAGDEGVPLDEAFALVREKHQTQQSP